MPVLQAWRSWRGAKGVALLATAAFAVGIGAATSIYTVVNGVMLKPLPYRDGGRYVAIFSATTKDPTHFGSLSFHDARAYRDRTRVFDAFGWFRFAGKNLVYGGEPHHVEGVAVTPPLVQQLGVAPALGQWFPDNSSVVISSALWRSLGGDPAIIGRPLTLDGRRYVVAGVMPDRFSLPVSGFLSVNTPTDVWIPLDPDGRGEPTDGVPYFVYARRKPDVTFAAAEADVRRVAAEIASEDPGGHPDYTSRVFDLRETVIREIRPTLLLLLGAAVLLFLVTCATAAGLLLARSIARARETATRIALGASRWQLARQCLVESLPIALAGAAAGVVLSLTLTPRVVSMVAEYVPRADEIVVDWAVVLFAAGAAVLASVLSSVAALWQALRTTSVEALGDGARTTVGSRSRRLSQSLVVGEVALAFALLMVSAMLIAHLRNLSRTPIGLNADNVLTFEANIPGSIADDDATRIAFQRRLIEAIQAVPGVQAVAFAGNLPIGCCGGTNIYPEGRPEEPLAGQRMSLMTISPEYFRVLGIPLQRGRLLRVSDATAEDPVVAVISQSAAIRYWGERDPIGAYGRLNSPSGSRFQVVGIVGDVRNDGLGSVPVPTFYISSALIKLETMEFVVRSTRSAGSIVPEIRRAVQGVDAELPIHQVATLRDIIQRSITLERAASLLTALFAAAALVLATLGIYGIVAYVVRQRRVEIGTRMALGATGRSVLALVVKGGVGMATLGAVVGGAIGLAAAVSLARVFNVGDVGPMPFLAATGVVGAVTLAASGVPAWRAVLFSPMVAIRDEPQSMWQAMRQRMTGVTRRSGAESPAVPLSTVIAEFGDAVRRADSPRRAIETALSSMHEHTGASDVMLLEKIGDEYRSRTCSIPAAGALLNRLAHYPHPLAVPQAYFDTWRRWAGEFKPEHLAEIEALGTTGVQMVVPLRTKHDIVGVLLLGAPSGREQYSGAERRVLSQSGEVIALMLENARLADRAMEQEKVRRDLAMAAEVQQRLLPPEAPQHAAATFAAFTLPARTIGGDYYDFLDLGGGAIGIAVADISGKGIPAALLMSVVHASLRVITAERGLPLPELAARMNCFLYQSTGANRYATFFYAQIEDDVRRLRYVNAGHNPPYLIRAARGGTEIIELQTGGTVIGMFPEVVYEEGQIDLHPDDVIVAFTDGVTEALNADGEEFGEERLKDVLRVVAGLPASDISTRLAGAMRQWIGHADQYDDLTFIVVSVGGSESAETGH